MIKILFLNKYFRMLFFITFVILSSIAMFNSFKSVFVFTTSGDEFYFESIYSLKNVSLNTITSVRSQYYIFCTSIVNEAINNPILSARIVSFFHFVVLFIYLIYQFKFLKVSLNKKIQYGLILFISIFMTGIVITGVSDFVAYFFLIIFIIELNKLFFDKKSLSNLKIVFLSLLVALAITNRPTVLIVLFVYALSLLFVFKKHIFKSKKVLLIPIIGVIFICIINAGAIKNTGFINLDVKEPPKEYNTNWFEQNYLTVKFWNEGINNKQKWVSANDAMLYKKENPDAYMPKNHFDLFIHEPVLYTKQMVIMFVHANYSLFLKLNFLYLMVLYVVYRKYFKGNKNSEFNNAFTSVQVSKIEATLYMFYGSVLIFSFYAYKLFEFRWVDAVFIIMLLYILEILSKLKNNTQNIILALFYIGFSLWMLKGYKSFLLT